MRLSAALIQEMTDALHNAEADLASGESAYHECTDEDRQKVELFGAIVANPTVAMAKVFSFTREWVADLLEDTAIRAHYFGKGDAPYEHHVAILKDYRHMTK